MTDQQLREELHRIAERAPEAYVPTDTFARGRRAHRRSVVIAISAISAAIVLIAGSVAFTQQRDSADVQPARGDTDLAVPDTIYATPTWLAETEDGHYANAGKLEHDLAIGTGAIAYVQPAQDSNGAVAVVVDADDGDYHPLALDDFIGLDPYWRNSSGDDGGRRPLALSPDGTQLAWSWGRGRDAGTDSQHVSNGVRVADLTTGEIFEWDLSNDGPTYVTGVKWSEGGNQLLWTGLQMDQWDSDAYVPADAVAGVITYASGTTTTYSGGIGTVTDLGLWAVSDDGTMAFNGDPGSDLQVQRAGGEITPLPLPDEASGYEPIMFHGSDLYVTTEDGLARVDGRGPTYPSPNKMPLVPVGWVGDGPLLELHGQDDIYFGQVWAVDDATGGEGGSSLIAVEGGAGVVVDTVSIAYDLIDADSIKHPTVHRSKPFFMPLWAGTAVFWLVSAVVAVVLWRRARRALLVVAALAALLVLVSALSLFDVTGLSSGSDTPRGPGGILEIESAGSPNTEAPGRAVIPQSIPWTNTPASDIPVSEPAAVGRAILAFSDEIGAVEDDGIAVVITAEGDYQRLRLPGVEGASDTLMGRPISLSPDGAQLAYVTEEPSVNVLDLETGEVTTHPLTLGGDEITSISWSPDSTWLVWHSDYEHQRAGRITPDGTVEPLPDGDWANAGIGNDGTVAAGTESGTRFWPEDDAADLPGAGQEGLSTWVGTGTAEDGRDDVRSIESDLSTRVDFVIGPTGRGVDVDGRRLVEVAGWLADGTPLIVTASDDGNDLRTVADDGSTEVVAEIDSRLHMLSIATALPDDIAVNTPDTAWAEPSPLRWLPPIGAIGAVVTGFLIWGHLRRRKTETAT
ncbi:WD40 repeat domain-containing protein [Nocardioides sp. NPDC126508]